MNTRFIFAFMLVIIIFYPMAAAFISYLIGRRSKKARDYFADFVVISELVLVLCTATMGFKPDPAQDFPIRILYYGLPNVAGLGLRFTMYGFSRVYSVVAALMWAVATVFSKEYFAHYHNRNRYYLFMLLTLGATMGVFLSADIYTLFIFFEMMSFTSYVWVAHDEGKASLRAAETYLAVAVIGGMVMLMGLFMLYHTLGSLEISMLRYLVGKCPDKKTLYIAGALISVGFGAKAGAFPLHIWLPKAHPVAPAPASALLSGMLTKAGIFGLLIVSCNMFFGDGQWGSMILIIAVITMFLGALLALFSVDLKRTLACSSVSQIGFIMVGIGCQGLLGEEGSLAAGGTILHMVNHSLFKLVLFLTAGVIFMNLHKLDLNEIRGFGRKKPLLHFIYLMGALGIGGIPLFSGYVSKTLLHEGIVEYTELLEEGAVSQVVFGVSGMKFIEWIFLISGGLTVAYMTKLYIAIFVEKNPDEKRQKEYDENKKYMSLPSSLVLTLSAVLLPVMGCLPNIIMRRIAYLGTSIMNNSLPAENISYFSLGNLKGAAISVTIGAAVYLLIVRLLLMKRSEAGKVYVNRWPDVLDLENSFYRHLIKLLCAVMGFASRVCDSLVDWIVVLLRKTVYKDKPLPFELTEGNMFTYHLGHFLEDCERLLNKRFPKRKAKNRNYIHELAMRYSELTENKLVITRTLSFGFLLFCAGFIVMMVYLVLTY